MISFPLKSYTTLQNVIGNYLPAMELYRLVKQFYILLNSIYCILLNSSGLFHKYTNKDQFLESYYTSNF